MEDIHDNKQETTQQQSLDKKEIWGAVGIIFSFYVAATIISSVVPEENYKMHFVSMLLPVITIVGYGYWAAMKENYIILKTVFIMLLVFVVFELVSRILLRI